jgi:hypothetical protein
LVRVPPLPVRVEALEEFITRVAVQYSFGTVQIAASAVIGFCALNNFSNPFKANPRAQLKLQAVRAIKSGASRNAKKGIDGEFILDMWGVCADMERKGQLSIADRRARAFCQLAFEAAMRGAEISQLKMCDLAFLGCTAECGKRGACQSHQGMDAWIFVRLAKTARDGRAQKTRLVWPERPTEVLGTSVTILACFEEDWLPFLHEHRMYRHPRCSTSSETKFRCEVCPPLFPTFPSKRSNVLRSVCVSTVTKGFKRMAMLTGRDPVGYTSHSGRVGGYSTATAEGCMPQVASRSMRWAGEKVPEKVYKRDNEEESKMAGMAVHKGIQKAASRPPVPPVNVGVVGKSIESEQKKGGKKSKRKEEKKEEEKEKVACPWAAFPMQVTRVGAKEVCRRFQFGVCPHGLMCGRAHVCNACGSTHAQGGLCKAGHEAVRRWLMGAQHKVQSHNPRTGTGRRVAEHVSPSPPVRSSPRLGRR